MESGVFCRNDMHALNVHQNDLSDNKESNYVAFSIYYKEKRIQPL
ncbi:hypothetical protein [Salinibacillus xinjiangensis]|nr:hypothetical protein [Salinibacillus xinjiangensis]